MFMNILGKLGGRKFLMAVFGIIVVLLHDKLGLDTTATTTVAGGIAAYILGQGVSDGMTGGATSSVAIAHDTIQDQSAPDTINAPTTTVTQDSTK